MKTVKLSDFSPYDRNKGGIQEFSDWHNSDI